MFQYNCIVFEYNVFVIGLPNAIVMTGNDKCQNKSERLTSFIGHVIITIKFLNPLVILVFFQEVKL